MSKYQQLASLTLGDTRYRYYSFAPLAEKYALSRLPYSAKILLENLLRHADSGFVDASDIETLAAWDTSQSSRTEIAFVPARVILQDFTGVPAVVDLAAMRDAMQKLGGDPQRINPLNPAELVIDHSVMVDVYGSPDALEKNSAIEFERNRERYQFLRWGQKAFDNFKVVPPGRGIVHQVNLEYLARVVFAGGENGELLYPDTLVGTDSHTTMINGLGVLGWGVGGIEAEAAMLGQPVSMLIPEVVGMELVGQLPPGTTATDLVLTVTEMLRKHGVVGKFVEFLGDGIQHLSLADRATLANMAPEYGATCGIFPIDEQTLEYLRLTGRDAAHIERIEAYCKAMGMWAAEAQKNAVYHSRLTLDLSTVQPSIAGPKRPQDRIILSEAATAFKQLQDAQQQLTGKASNSTEVDCTLNGTTFTMRDGHVVIAAITSCTNTSNPSVLMAAGLLARKARERGLTVKPWVKTSLAPGSRVVTEYLKHAGLLEDLSALGFSVVGYGCTTCIGNSGPLPDPIAQAIRDGDLTVTSVLSGNRNFEGRIHPLVKANYLASPPLVVAYALAGSMNVDLTSEPLGNDQNGQPVYLRDLWPSAEEIKAAIDTNLSSEMFKRLYQDVFEGDARWQQLPGTDAKSYDWPESTYIRKPPFFDDMTLDTPEVAPITNARVLLKLGDSVTTDHISPAGAIALDSPAAEYLKSHGVEPKDFNSYGSRRGNHEVMMRGTFANIRLRNQLAPGTEGGWTRIFPEGEQTTVFDAAMRYQAQGIPTIVLAGKEYGTGSSRDWAAKGPALLGVKAVIAQSYERIHRSNLIGMGILPLQFKDGDSADSLGLTGEEEFTIPAIKPEQKAVTVYVTDKSGETRHFDAIVRIDTPNEFLYYKNGGILHFVLRKLAKNSPE